ncbi:MAG TPA: sulfur carrier protein ThiS [Casimicrobiaceae bacterium]
MTASATTDALRVEVNGCERRFAAGATIADIVVAMGVAGKRIAVERNGEIVPRSRHAETAVADGDRIEIVGAVGGG